MFSDRPGTPGRRQQMPRTMRSISVPAARRLVERVDDLGVDEAVHLHHDAAVGRRRPPRGSARASASAALIGATRIRRYAVLVAVAGEVVEEVARRRPRCRGRRSAGRRPRRSWPSSGGSCRCRCGSSGGSRRPPRGRPASLRVRLQPDDAVDDVDAGFLEHAGPGDVRLLVEARLQLDQRHGLLAGLGGAHQRAHDAGCPRPTSGTASA